MAAGTSSHVGLLLHKQLQAQSRAARPSIQLSRREWQRPSVALRLTQVATGILVVVYLGSTLFRARHGNNSFYDVWVGNLGYGGCALLCVWRAWRTPVQRWAWATIGLSLAIFTAGAVLWTSYVQYLNPLPYPSIADFCFLVFYPVAYLGVGLLIRDTVAKSSNAFWLDGIIAALGVAALESTLVIGQISHGNRGDFATVATNIAYPIGDLVLVCMVVAAFALRSWRPGAVWWMLGIGLAIFTGADSVYVLRVTSGTYMTGTPLDSLWLIGAFLMGSAAWLRQREPQTRRATDQPIVVPALFILSSLAIIVVGNWGEVLPLGVFLAAATLIVAITRTGFAYRQLRALAESRREARTDGLTGLPNRRHFFELLQKAIEVREPDAELAVLMIDLNRFKELNDTLGHKVGDDALALLGARLATVAHLGTVARLGGDEFGLALEGGVDEALAAAAEVGSVLAAPLDLLSMSLSLDASIGIAVAPRDGTTADKLLQKADVAMYEAKRAHHPWEVYSAKRDMHSRARLELLAELPDAIVNGQIEVHYQPQLDLKLGRITGVEALVRWRHPRRGLLYPDKFLGLAQESGLLTRLALAVLDQALAQRAAWDARGISLRMSVNLSAADLMDSSLPERVMLLLAKHGVEAGALQLELTEDSLMSDPDQALEVLSALKALGLELAIDDYGTGFSSLTYLRSLPVNELKVDRSFLTDLTNDWRALPILKSTINLAHSLGLRLVAEGLEDADTLRLVAELGCDYGQGYQLGRAVPAAELESVLVRSRLPLGAQPGPVDQLPGSANSERGHARQYEVHA